MTAAIEILRAALAGRSDHAELCALRAKPVWKGRIRFSWVDCLARESGVVVIVAEEESERTATALLEALNEWRGAVKAKGAAA